MALIIPNSFASKTSAQLSDLDDNFTYLKTELDPYVDNIIVDESGQVTIAGGVVADVTGNADTVTNGVYTVGNQTIDGIKTFTSNILGSITGNSGTVTNGVYTTNFSGSNQSLTANGYQKFPGGLIIQWGKVTASSGAQSVTFPTAFTTACYYVGPIDFIPGNTGGVGTNIALTAVSTTGFTTSSINGREFYWVALGY